MLKDQPGRLIQEHSGSEKSIGKSSLELGEYAKESYLQKEFRLVKGATLIYLPGTEEQFHSESEN